MSIADPFSEPRDVPLPARRGAATALAMLVVALACAGAARGARGAGPGPRALHLAPTLATVEAAPCDGARLLQTANGDRYETGTDARLVPGAVVRVSGTIYPGATRCRLHPWLRLDPDAVAAPAPLEARWLPSLARLLQQAAAQATARGESGLPFAPESLPQIEISGDPAAWAALRDALRGWSAWALAPRWHRLPPTAR